MSKIALIKEEWPSVAGHAGSTKLYEVKVVREYEHAIIAKRHWYSRKTTYVKDGMFVKVLQIFAQSTEDKEQ
ncbi:MAG TPA: hypothetical protein PKD15_00895 [Candidatus Saccharibacteria bacterium]|nr:hypothetical protein [Candidatus Saccharibacteria bacterium]